MQFIDVRSPNHDDHLEWNRRSWREEFHETVSESRTAEEQKHLTTERFTQHRNQFYLHFALGGFTPMEKLELHHKGRPRHDKGEPSFGQQVFWNHDCAQCHTP